MSSEISEGFSEEGNPELNHEICLPFNSKTEALYAIEKRYQRLKKDQRVVGFEYLLEEDLREAFQKYIPKEELIQFTDEEIQQLFHDWYSSMKNKK